MSKVVSVLLVIVGLINVLPVLGMLSADRLSRAYGVTISGADLEILLRHRALLFGIVGGFVLYAVYAPAYQPPAMVMAAVSMVGYLFFMWQVGGYNGALEKVMLIDVVGIVCLAIACALKYAGGSD